MGSFCRFAVCFLIVLSCDAPGIAQEAEHVHASLGSEKGLGRAHMEISCSPAVAAKFDRALALLHNFWYRRALEGFQQVSNSDPECAIAYWGAAMTYNHPFWDAPSSADETAALGFVQKGLAAKKVSPREKLYLNAVAALFKDAGAATGIGGVVAGFGDQREVELLVEAGFTPVEAIHIATENGARFLHEED